MASPTLETGWATSTTSGTTATSLTCTAPSGIASGNTLFIIIGSDDNGSANEFTINTGTYPGWEKQTEFSPVTVAAHCAIFTKDAGGSEGDVVVDSASSDEIQAIYGRISGADYSSIVSGSTEDSASPWVQTIATLSPSDDWLLIGGMSMDGGDGGTITVSGTGWSKITQVTSGTGANDNMDVYNRKC
jgi:hypothetical protein